ncbi:nucleophosmin-like [Pristis pectinata]|uniref:nucleophosmin-like n=1 Tax=Pristis pectinata TaxID=685728 RepID=UPI00223D11FD|nr:nucleophosmin-like [Pristis pectinata]
MEDYELDNALENASLPSRTFLFGCELKSTAKEFKMEVADDSSEHQLSLRAVCLGADASDDLHLVEVEGLNFEGKNTKVTLAALRLSVQPTVSLGGFEIEPPVTFRLKSGTGPVYISGQHLIADLDSDEEDDSVLENAVTKQAVKRTAPGVSKIMQKKMKMEDDDDFEDDDDEDDDEDDDDEDDEEEEEEEEVAVVTPAKKKTPQKDTPGPKGAGPKGASNQNGKTPAKSTPAKQQSKTPESTKKPSNKPQTPKTPKPSLTAEDIKAKLKASMEKGAGLPKGEAKFSNYIKHGFRMEDPEIIKELWAWRQSADGK